MSGSYRPEATIYFVSTEARVQIQPVHCVCIYSRLCARCWERRMERCGPGPQEVLGLAQKCRKNHNTLHKEKYSWGVMGQGEGDLSHLNGRTASWQGWPWADPAVDVTHQERGLPLNCKVPGAKNTDKKNKTKKRLEEVEKNSILLKITVTANSWILCARHYQSLVI